MYASEDRGHDVGAGERIGFPSYAGHAHWNVIGARSPKRGAEPDHDHAAREGRKQAHQLGLADHAMDGDPIQHDTEEKADDGHEWNRRISGHPDHGREKVQHEHAQHDHRAVRQIDHVHDAPDQSEAHRGNSINGADEHAVDNGREDPDHAIPRAGRRTSCPPALWAPAKGLSK